MDAPFCGRICVDGEERRVTDQQQPSQDNSLDDFATLASRTLGASPVELNDRAVETVEGGQVSIRDSFVQNIHARALSMDDTVAGIMRAGVVEAKEGTFGIALARQMNVENMEAGVVAASNIEARSVDTFLLLAFNVKGDVSSVISPLAGLAIGAGFASVLLMGRLLWRRGRKASA